MFIQFIWSDRYKVGNAEIDRQHERMFALVNTLPDELDRAVIKTNLMALAQHAREHFDTEEQMMARIGYPNLREHQKLHAELSKKLLDLDTGDYKSFGSDESVSAFKQLILDWMIGHIMTHDRDFFRFSHQLAQARKE